jgi:hypothetical protein
MIRSQHLARLRPAISREAILAAFLHRASIRTASCLRCGLSTVLR